MTFLTDFGSTDNYVGVVKGAILSIAPDARVVDLTHSVPPQDILRGAFLIGSAWQTFPFGTIHLAVVDPGVGTKRRPILLWGHGHYFIGPDNGLFTQVLFPEFMQRQPGKKLFEPLTKALPSGFNGAIPDKEEFWRRPTSTTFHARDVFGPIAAYLATGTPPWRFGTPLKSLVTLYTPAAERTRQSVNGYVLHIDTYGNIITNIRHKDLPSDRVLVTIGKHTILGLNDTYGTARGLTTLISGEGLLEVALRNGSAAKRLNAQIGTPVVVTAN